MTMYVYFQMDPTDMTKEVTHEMAVCTYVRRETCIRLWGESRSGSWVDPLASTSCFRFCAEVLVDRLAVLWYFFIPLKRTCYLPFMHFHDLIIIVMIGVSYRFPSDTTSLARFVNMSPLGALVANRVHDALSTDAIVAVITYKWDMYAGKIYRRQAMYYCFFMALYITTTTIGLEWYPSVGRLADMYGRRGVWNMLASKNPALLVKFLDAVGIERLTQVAMQRRDENLELMPDKKLVVFGSQVWTSGFNAYWNWVELFSSVMVVLVLLLQLLGVEEARWVMSACTMLLGIRMLQVASGLEGPGIYVQIIIRIIKDLGPFLLIVAITLATYSFAFRQFIVYYEQQVTPQGYADDAAGGIERDVGGKAKYVWYLHAMIISFSFFVSIILLNLLIATMSTSYQEVQTHAKQEWMQLKAKLILDIEYVVPESFFKNRNLSAPKWLYVFKKKDGNTRQEQQHTPLDAVRCLPTRMHLGH
ncbi:hypothetical protein VOLCADRAFT_108483 [Volvox carteri f. nagariensis]|uniref:Ion transport domain-containing protein n=1 Tax=Volvox carteri f. nagariensis TaxID=3068 RepID=D8UKD8_VOLCA|nr:uncharacterized protein VOLCADRAFT_108483 [Volvox carteri f. nagariensis]EFJ39810.1 hypothetical protein VOLCADRAFT_108483 [Volvox carteri f. nagariensis]|eukprot:XP_002959129.1 hypothetical protein VOLCADRAFT_108483 [Volvox carteri f. nagariensis]